MKAPAGKSYISGKQNVQKVNVDSWVLVSDSPIQTRKKETGDSHSGLVAMNVLAVCECLFCDQVADLATKLEGVSNFIS